MFKYQKLRSLQKVRKTIVRLRTIHILPAENSCAPKAQEKITAEMPEDAEHQTAECRRGQEDR